MDKSHIEEQLLKGLFFSINKEAGKLETWILRNVNNINLLPGKIHKPIKDYNYEAERFVKRNRKLVKFKGNSATVKVEYKSKITWK